MSPGNGAIPDAPDVPETGDPEGASLASRIGELVVAAATPFFPPRFGPLDRNSIIIRMRCGSNEIYVVCAGLCSLLE